jgi:SAM-dependent methyltransferase
MRIGLIPETPWERVLLWLGRVPTPLAETHLAFLHARAIMAAAEVGLFDALADGPRQPGELAATCRCDPDATRRLLDALAAARYLRRQPGGFALTPLARRWLLTEGAHSVTAKLQFQQHEWDFAARLPAFVRRGEAVDIHREMPPEAWRRYHLAMRDLARLAAPEVARKTPLPRRGGRLLDVGGAHGLFAAACCARRPELTAEVLDLPAALPTEPAPLAGTPGGERVSFRPADARHEDLGEDAADVVLIANLAHHLSEDENRDLLARASRALRPGGHAVVVEWTGDDASASGRLLDLYFALTSRSGTWTAREVAAWQRDAGLKPLRPRRLRTLPGTALLAARKP